MRIHFTGILLLLILVCSHSNAQRISAKALEAHDKRLQEHPLLKDDADFTSQTSTAWPNESAVLLSHKTSFDFDKKGASSRSVISRNLWGAIFAIPTLGTSLLLANSYHENSIVVEENERRRILMQDKYAVDQFSVVYFRFNNLDLFAARIIKKDGSTEEVSLKDAARVSNIKEVPADFTGYTDYKASASYQPIYFKVAIPNLEVGDVLEYEFFHTNTQVYFGQVNYKEFDPVYYLCNRSMPVEKQVIEISTDNKNFVGYRAMRGAGQFEAKDNGDKKTYRWVDQHRDKLKDTRYLNEYVELPAIKFQVIYASNRKQDFIWFKNQDELNRPVTKEELTEKVKLFWYEMDGLNNMSLYTEGISKSPGTLIKNMYNRIKENGSAEAKEEDYVRNVYYMIRSYTLRSGWHDFVFAQIMSGMMAKRNIAHDIVVTTSNNRTNIQDLAFNREIIWGIRFNNKYYFNPNDHLNPGEIPSYLAGNECLTFPAADSKSKAAVKYDIVPGGDTSTNKFAYQLKVTLDTSLTAFNIQKEVEITGACKEGSIDEILAGTAFLETDVKNYGGSSMWDYEPKNQQEKLQEEWAAQKKEWKEEKPKQMQALAESEYSREVKKYDQFRLLQDGRAFKKMPLKYSEQFSLDETVAKAGDDLIVDLPLLIGTQTQLKKEERTRMAPINFGLPRTLSWTITLAIPVGYTLADTDNLNHQVSNETGSFISKATIAGNLLTIEVSKQYKGKFFELSQWSNAMQFIDAAYNFSQSKIILKKQ